MPRFVFRPGHPKASKWGFVDVNELGPEPELATNAPILAGRFYENVAATDGTDIGSRRKHREWKRRNGYADESDYSDKWRAERAASLERAEDKATRETVARNLYALEKRK